MKATATTGAQSLNRYITKQQKLPDQFSGDGEVQGFMPQSGIGTNRRGGARNYLQVIGGTGSLPG